MRKIKLIYLINDLGAGGAEKAMLRITEGLDKSKYNTLVICFRKGAGLNTPGGVDVVSLGAKNKFDLKAIYRLYALLRRQQPDLLWCSLWHSTIVGRIIGKLAQVPVIINWEHNQNLGNWFRILANRLTAKLSKIIIADSQKVAEAAERKLRISSKKIHTIQIAGIDLEKFKSVNHKSGKSCVIGSVGMLQEQKGYTYLVAAAKEIVKKYPEIRFVIAGSGNYKDNLERQIKESDLTQNFFLLGYQSDVAKFLSQLDIYVQPSLWEGLCITVVEAMAAGLPIVASNVGGIPESVIDGKNGYLIEPKNSTALAEKIICLIENPQLRKKMGEKSRKIAQNKYSLEIMIKKIDKLLKNLAVCY